MSKSIMKKVPITVFTGHLGSGKTTLIQKLLALYPDKKVLVIENEFGEIGIDGEILSQNDNALVELNSGCVCCNIQSDLELILEKFIADKSDFDHIIIETTGVANPAKIARQFLSPHYLSGFFELNSIICLLDALHFDKHRSMPEFELQLLTSDTYYISKAEDLSKEERGSFCEKNGVNEERVIDDQDLKIWFEKKSFENLSDNISLKGGHHHYQKLAFEFEGEFDPFTLENYLNVLFMQYMGSIFRSKGVLYFRKAPHPVVFQGVFDSLSFDESQKLKEKTKRNRIIFIGKDLNEEKIEASLKNCLAEEEK